MTISATSLIIQIKTRTEADANYVSCQIFSSGGLQFTRELSEFQESGTDALYKKRNLLSRDVSLTFTVKYTDPTRADIAKIFSIDESDGKAMVRYAPSGTGDVGDTYWTIPCLISAQQLPGGIGADQELEISLMGDGKPVKTTVT